MSKPNLSLKPYIKTAGVLLLLSACSLAAWSVQQKYKHAQKPKAQVPVEKPVAYNAALLQKLNGVLKEFDFANKPYTLAGTMSTINKADSTNMGKNLSFLFSKNGNNCYYKLKDLEMLNADSIYLFIDHANKKVVIAGHKDINVTSVLNGIDKLQSMLQSEKYDLKDSKNGADETISLINEHHVTCKEYALTFDTLSNKLNRIYGRFTDFDDITNKSKDKIVDIRISSLSNEAVVGSYLNPQSVVKRIGDHWILKGTYSGYQLIQM